MMNPWFAGKLAKLICQRKRTRKFWNIVFSLFILFLLFFAGIFLYRVLCDHLVREEEHVYIGCSDGLLVTEIGTYKIAHENKQEVNISKLKTTLKHGDKIVLSLSKISGELMEAKHLSSTVYRVKVDQLDAFIILMVIFFLPFLGLSIFMLIVTNIKNPNKKIDSLQRKFLLR